MQISEGFYSGEKSSRISGFEHARQLVETCLYPMKRHLGFTGSRAWPIREQLWILVPPLLQLYQKFRHKTDMFETDFGLNGTFKQNFSVSL